MKHSVHGPVFQLLAAARDGVYRAAPLDAIALRARHADEGTWPHMAQAFDLRAPRPPVRACLALVLRLHEADRVRDAAELAVSFERWLGASGTGELRAHLAGMWRAARELEALADVVPLELRAPIARGFRTGRLGEAARAVRGACAELGEGETAAARAVVREVAPSIGEVFGRALEGEAGFDDGDRARRAGGGAAMLLMVVSVVAGLAFWLGASPEAPEAPVHTRIAFDPFPEAEVVPAAPALGVVPWVRLPLEGRPTEIGPSPRWLGRVR